MRFLFFIVVLFSFVTVGYGQFTTILGVPPDEAPFSIGSDTQLNLFDGGRLDVAFDAGPGTNIEVNIFSGTVREFFFANDGSTVNIYGGEVDDDFFAHNGSTVNIYGGDVDDDFFAGSGSTVNLFGTRFVLDSMDITVSLTPNESFTINDRINDRDATLSGLLADGSRFVFSLDQDNIDPLATLSVTLVLLGDANGDGLVNIDDLNEVRNNFGGEGPDDGTLQGDAFPFDGTVDINDLNAVRNSFGAGAAAAPEPSGMTLAAIGLLVFAHAPALIENRRHPDRYQTSPGPLGAR